jgi:hypothetical protein
MLENHNPCDIIFLQLDQTILTLDASDGLLEVSRGLVTLVATLGVAPTRWARRPPPWLAHVAPGVVGYLLGGSSSLFSYYFLHTNHAHDHVDLPWFWMNC